MTVEAERLAAFLSQTPYAGFLGIEATWIDGEVTAILPYRRALIGNTSLPALHGGVLGGFLELTALLTLSARLETGKPSTVDFTIEYLRSAGPRDTHARSRVKRLGRRFANVEVVAWQDDPGRPVAAISGRFALVA